MTIFFNTKMVQFLSGVRIAELLRFANVVNIGSSCRKEGIRKAFYSSRPGCRQGGVRLIHFFLHEFEYFITIRYPRNTFITQSFRRHPGLECRGPWHLSPNCRHPVRVLPCACAALCVCSSFAVILYSSKMLPYPGAARRNCQRRIARFPEVYYFHVKF